MSERHTRTCHLCEAMCGLVVTTEAGRVTDIRGDKEDVFSRGHICPKAFALKELHDDGDRLRVPLRRRGNDFEEISFEQAIEETTDRFAAIQRKHGKDAVGTYIGNPSAHNHGTILMGTVLSGVLATRNRFDANSQDANPKLFASLRAFGDLLSMTIPDVDRTRFFLAFGANPVASNGSIMTLGDVRGRLNGIRARGGSFVVVDPRRTETAKIASEHLAIRPGGDAAFILAMLRVIFDEGLLDREALGRTTRNLAALERATEPFTPARVAARVGIEAERIADLARRFATTKPAVAYGRIGVCQNEFGVLASFLIEALNVVTGNFDTPGGAMFTEPAIDLGPIARRFGVQGAGHHVSRVRKLPEVGGNLPAAAIAEEIETPGEGQIRGFLTIAGNPVSSVPNGERLRRALSTLELMVSVDIYLNETTRHAHLILPPCSPLERGHYDLIFCALAVRNVAKYSPPVLPPKEGSREDWDILYDIATGLLAKRSLPQRLEALSGPLGRLFAGIKPRSETVLDLLLRAGPHGLRSARRLDLAKLRAAPHGVDLGPLRPMGKERVRTPDGRVELGPVDVLRDAARVDRWLDEAPRGLVLIGRRHVRSNNSWMHNLTSLTKGPTRTALFMNPADAASRGIKSGDRVRVRSRVGEIEVGVEITDDVRPGVASLPHGFGQSAVRDHLRVAGALDGASMNTLTDDEWLEPLSATSILNGTPVRVDRVAEVSVDAE